MERKRLECNAVEREQDGESVTGAGGTGSALEARNEPKR